MRSPEVQRLIIVDMDRELERINKVFTCGGVLNHKSRRELNMRDYVEIGACPAEEPAIQVMKDRDTSLYQRKQCTIYKNQLIREFGNPPEGASFVTRGNEHDFGRYYEVAVTYDDSFPEAIDFAFNVENESPAEWDALAKEEMDMLEKECLEAGVSLT